MEIFPQKNIIHSQKYILNSGKISTSTLCECSVVALAMRGYGHSDKPSRVSDYAMPHLIDDVAFLVKHLSMSLPLPHLYASSYIPLYFTSIVQDTF